MTSHPAGAIATLLAAVITAVLAVGAAPARAQEALEPYPPPAKPAPAPATIVPPAAPVVAPAPAMSPAPAMAPAAPAVAPVAPTLPGGVETHLAPGDQLKITVFQNPDLTLETRVEENGTISYPLIGAVPVNGLSPGAVEKRIEQLLHDGGFIVAPHVTVAVVQVRGSQVTVLGQVVKPGRFPLDETDTKITDFIALAGGVAPTGADAVVLTGIRNGKPIRREIDLQELAASGDSANNLRLSAGDMLFVNRAPTFYIYGEVQKPGAYRLEKGMTVMQALATGGGLTPKGTQRGLAIHRRGKDGAVQVVEPKLDDAIAPDDVITIKESIF
jgi:polysaccharide export outer membrane protein